jgi:hypothetical protein
MNVSRNKHTMVCGDQAVRIDICFKAMKLWRDGVAYEGKQEFDLIASDEGRVRVINENGEIGSIPDWLHEAYRNWLVEKELGL